MACEVEQAVVDILQTAAAASAAAVAAAMAVDSIVSGALATAENDLLNCQNPAIAGPRDNSYREKLMMELWRAVYLATCGGEHEAEKNANAAVEAFRKAFP